MVLLKYRHEEGCSKHDYGLSRAHTLQHGSLA